MSSTPITDSPQVKIKLLYFLQAAWNRCYDNPTINQSISSGNIFFFKTVDEILDFLLTKKCIAAILGFKDCVDDNIVSDIKKEALLIISYLKADTKEHPSDKLKLFDVTFDYSGINKNHIYTIFLWAITESLVYDYKSELSKLCQDVYYNNVSVIELSSQCLTRYNNKVYTEIEQYFIVKAFIKNYKKMCSLFRNNRHSSRGSFSMSVGIKSPKTNNSLYISFVALVNSLYDIMNSDKLMSEIDIFKYNNYFFGHIYDFYKPKDFGGYVIKDINNDNNTNIPLFIFDLYKIIFSMLEAFINTCNLPESEQQVFSFDYTINCHRINKYLVKMPSGKFKDNFNVIMNYPKCSYKNMYLLKSFNEFFKNWT